MDISQKARVLVDALPYIKKYFDKTIVVKYGGNAMVNEELKEAVMSDIVLLNLVGVKVVLVHGGGPEINEMLKKMDIESKFINGLRYTDKETAEVVRMVLAGKVNKGLVGYINGIGGNAIGLCGTDGNMLTVSKKSQDGVDYGYVGEIEKVNSKSITDCLKEGYIPVVATIATDKEGNVYNINADTAAAMIAAELNLAVLFAVHKLACVVVVRVRVLAFTAGKEVYGSYSCQRIAPKLALVDIAGGKLKHALAVFKIISAYLTCVSRAG